MPDTAPLDPDPLELRRDLRVPGPFDGKWIGALIVPLHIFDLSTGGCLIQAYHELSPGRRFTLQIELPEAGWIEIEAESLYVREGYGFAARFVGMTGETRTILDRVIRRLKERERGCA